jgi:hypothetical protein
MIELAKFCAGIALVLSAYLLACGINSLYERYQARRKKP